MHEKTRMVWLGDGVEIHERDRHTQTPHDDIGRACIASRSKKVEQLLVFSNNL